MRCTNRYRHILAVLTLAGALLLPNGAGVRADDTALFSNQVPPNVVLIVDNSGSMNQITWHQSFRPDVVYDTIACPYIADPNDPAYDPKCLKFPLCSISSGDSAFTAGSGNSWSTGINLADYQTRDGLQVNGKCGNDRFVFNDPEVDAVGQTTGWGLTYLQWYFSENVEEDPDGDGDTILDDMIATTNGTRSQCVVNQGHSATYSIHRRARITAAKDITREVVCNTNQVAEIRYGLAKFYSGFGSDPEGGYMTVPVDDYTTSHQAALDTAIGDVEAESYTPLGETLYNIYRYFQSRSSSQTAIGKDGSTRFPTYNRRITGSVSSSSIPPSPVSSECQKNFVILVTDGEPTKDDMDSIDPSKSVFKDDLIGDYNLPGDEDEEPGGSLEPGFYLDDVAKFMQDNDFLPNNTLFPGVQVIDTYTVGFSTTAVANDLLQRTADAGNGLFFFSNNAEELTEALTQTINDIVAKSKSFTAATVPASRASDGNNFFTSYFNPSSDSPFWAGHLKLFEFNAAGEIRDAPPSPGVEGECALDDPLDPARCEQGRLKLTLSGFWDAANEIPAADSSGRKLYVSKYQSAAPSTIPAVPAEFTYEPSGARVTAADLGITGAGSTEINTYDLGLSEFDVTGIADDEELADAIVRYIRGCNFDDGPCTDRGDGNKLWDIFHSNPVVIGPPNAGLREGTYRDFVQKYKHRKRVIYAGSNGGFVHGFNAGEYDTVAVPGSYDRGTGAEEFGFMAYPARQVIAEVAKDTPPREHYTMDGSPSAADVWLYPNATDQPSDGTWNDWRTVLIGGMREGVGSDGRGAVWALDVTNPPDHNSPGGEQATGPSYPGYLWEFPCEASACDAWRPFVGQTWSQPVITRIKVTIDCSTNCTEYDRWVAIFAGGYDDSGDPNLAHETNSSDVQAGEYDASLDAGTSSVGRAIFMVDVATGELLAAKRFQYDGTSGDPSDGEPDMRFAFASAPSVFDLDVDGYADMVYIGDLGGNLWKWVIRAPGEDHINGSQGDDQQDRWKFLKIFQAESCLTCSPKHYKSFYFSPTGALVGQSLYLGIGSGERTDLDYAQDGVTDVKERNRFYVFKDLDPFELERDPLTLPYTDAGASIDFVDATTITDTNPNTCLPTGSVGFYLEGEDGEKFITDSTIFFGIVLTGSYVPPPSSASACDAVGEAYLYAFHLLCGEGVFDPSGSPSDPKERRVHVGGGLPNAPRVSVGPLGDDDDDDCPHKAVVITSEGEGFSPCKFDEESTGFRIQTWRDF